MRDSILVVRPTVQLDAGTPEAPELVTAPAVPAGWTDYQIEAGGWITYWPRGRVERPHVFVHVLLVAPGLASGRACFLFTGPSTIIDVIRDASFRAWEGAPALRADGTAVAVAVRAAWLSRDASAGFVASRMAGFSDTDGEARVVMDESATGDALSAKAAVR